MIFMPQTLKKAPFHTIFDPIKRVPEKYLLPNSTFVINEQLTMGANIFLHAGIQITLGMLATHPTAPHIGMRKAYEFFAQEFSGPHVDVRRVENSSVDVKTHTIPIRIYQNAQYVKDRLIIYAHGGGWARGSLDTHDALCRHLCVNTQTTVIAIDYRLTPEHPFPAGFEDVCSVYQWALTRPDQLNIDPHARLIMMGDSAGGNIIAGANLWMMDHHIPLPSQNVLIYPALDLRIPEETRNPYANGFLLTRDSMNKYTMDYVVELDKTHHVYASPLLASDTQLRQFPPTYILSAQCDPLTEQAALFIEKAKKSGNTQISHHVEPKTLHIFAQFFGVFEEAQNTLLQATQYICREPMKS